MSNSEVQFRLRGRRLFLDGILCFFFHVAFVKRSLKYIILLFIVSLLSMSSFVKKGKQVSTHHFNHVIRTISYSWETMSSVSSCRTLLFMRFIYLTHSFFVQVSELKFGVIITMRDTFLNYVWPECSQNVGTTFSICLFRFTIAVIGHVIGALTFSVFLKILISSMYWEIEICVKNEKKGS